MAGVLLNGYSNKYSQGEHNTSTIVNDGVPDTLIRHANSEINHWSSYSANLNLQHNFRANEKLEFNADWIRYSPANWTKPGR